MSGRVGVSLWVAAWVFVGLLWAPRVEGQALASGAALVVASGEAAGGERSLPLIDEDVDVVIDQQHATTKLRHVFHNDGAAQLEGQFSLRAGAAAMVYGFAYYNGEQKIVGEVFEKALATSIYGDTVAQRRDPGLLTQAGEGLFTFRVFPIQPGEHKRVELVVDQWLPRHHDVVEYRVPIRRGDADVRIEIRDERAIGNIHSTSHKLLVERFPGRVLVSSDGMRGTRSELVLRYQLLDKPWTLTAAVHRDPNHDGYLMLALPAAPAEAAVAKDVTLVIDRSGSMLGEPLAHAKRAAESIVNKLDAGDRVNVIAFDDAVDALFAAPEPVDPKVKERARKYIDAIDEGGGTNIALALESAFVRQRGTRPKTVLFLTDGRSNNKAALAAVATDAHDVRVFTVGLGDKVDKPLLSRLSAMKRGRFTYVESAATLPRRMSKLFDAISAPALVGLSLSVQGDNGALYRSYPRTLPDVFVGDELVVVSRVQGDGPIKVVLTGTSAGGPVVVERTVQLPEKVSRRWVGRLWARARVDHLLEEMALVGPAEELVSETKELGLAYNLLTPYTAFLAIPEAELTAAGTKMLAAARAQKHEALALNPDAAALHAPSPTEGGEAPVEEQRAAPAPEAGGFGGRGGCAGCATSGRGPGSAVLGWLVLAGVIGARGRGRRRGRSR